MDQFRSARGWGPASDLSSGDDAVAKFKVIKLCEDAGCSTIDLGDWSSPVP
jgi:predicted dinucleotide-binding enzyme